MSCLAANGGQVDGSGSFGLGGCRLWQNILFPLISLPPRNSPPGKRSTTLKPGRVGCHTHMGTKNPPGPSQCQVLERFGTRPLDVQAVPLNDGILGRLQKCSLLFSVTGSLILVCLPQGQPGLWGSGVGPQPVDHSANPARPGPPRPTAGRGHRQHEEQQTGHCGVSESP